jgi:hypothetical protein
MTAAAPKLADALVSLRDPERGETIEASVEELFRFALDLRRSLEEALTGAADSINFAGQQRFNGQRVYRFDDTSGLWVSSDRLHVAFGFSGNVAAAANTLRTAGGVQPGAGEGYRLAQSAVLVRWAWQWSGAATAGDTCALLGSSSTLKSTALAGGATSLVEELLTGSPVTIAAGQALRTQFTSANTTPQDVVALLELAWTTTFES